MEGDEGVDHGGHGDQGKQRGADAADAVAKVQQADGQAAQDDGEVQPAQESALVREEDLGLDPRREGDAFSCGWNRWKSICDAVGGSGTAIAVDSFARRGRSYLEPFGGGAVLTLSGTCFCGDGAGCFAPGSEAR